MPYASIENTRASQARYRAKNKEKIIAYREANKEKILSYNRERYARIMANPEKAAKQQERRRAYYTANRDRCIELEKRWRRENPERVRFNDRNKGLVRKYGITEHDYQRMHEKQGGLCVICGNPEKAKNRRLAVDHCHGTGRIRGLLCGRCNGALGWFEKFSTAVTDYLSKHRGE